MATDTTVTAFSNHTDADTNIDSVEQRYIICMKWGDKYGAEYVNRLYNMVSRHLTLAFQMVCLTDDSSGIDPSIKCYPIPEMDLPAGPERGWKKLTTFKPELYDLKGVALFLDIDIVIVDNMDGFFTYQAQHDDTVVIIRDWKKPWRMIGNSSVYRFNVGMNTYPDLLSNFEQNFDTIRKQVRHEQAYLSNYLREHHHLEYWDKSWCVSFKYQCIAPIPFNVVRAPKLPTDAKIVIFHGEINPPDAIDGTGGKWYRHIKPSPWLQAHWQ